MSDEYADIVHRAESRRGEDAAFLRRLKNRRGVPWDDVVRDAADEAFRVIDCLRCGRCCRDLGPRLTTADVGRLAKRERLKPARFVASYLRIDEDGDMVFREMPCRYFGADGRCLIYEDRPSACRAYPHLHESRQKSRIEGHIRNLETCPAVIEAVRELRGRLG